MRAEDIASLDDPRLGEYRKVANPEAIQRAGLFVAEGRLVVGRLLAQNRLRTRSILVTPTAAQALTTILQDALPPVYVVTQPVMDQIVGFNIHRGCLALGERPAHRTIDSVPLADLSRVLVLEGVNNPDNVGGLFRSAAAFAVNTVILGPGCGDPFYRKAIRTSMAATLQVPFVNAGPWPEALARLRVGGIRVLALTTDRSARALDDLPRDLGRTALVVGNEGEGLADTAMAACDEHVRIPMTPAVDSLNVTVAASIAMHHFFATTHRDT